jgi:23S rRNA (adenine2030-N6)-methyltransferase
VQAATLAPDVRALLKPYLDAVGPWAAPERPAPYPGSPLLALALMRPQDRLIACEAEPGAARELTRRLGADRRAKAITIDGWTALSAYIPPKERRGIALIDPPFERADEFERLPERIAAAHRKWATGIYLVWYPIKDRAAVERLATRLARAGIPKALHSQLLVAPAGEPAGLAGSGLIIVNPPWRLAEELAVLAPALAIAMARESPGRARLDWLAGGP